ncbi:hypothetical protein MNBD_PLANCTO03-1799, partial [hydrothermal vent metagenome]
KILEKEIEALDFEEARLGAQEGALSVINDLLIELDGLVVSAANTGAMADPDREAMQMQADSILETLDFIYTTAQFRGERLFDGLFTTGAGKVTIEGQDDDLGDGDGGITSKTAYLASMGSGGLLNLVDGDLEAAQESVKAALGSVNGRRGAIGNRIKHGIQSDRTIKMVEMENLTQAKSNIEDTDIAAEMSNMIRGQFLQQASIYTMLIAKQTPNAALQLLSSNVAIANGQ